MRLLPIFLILILTSPTSFAANTLNFDQLLKQAKSGHATDRANNRKRLETFQNNKNQQVQLLNEAMSDLKNEQKRSKTLEQQFETNDAKLTTLEAELSQQQGKLKELLGNVQHLTSDTLTRFEDSIISAQHPHRVEELKTIEKKMSDTLVSVSIQDIRTVWIEILNDLIESGKSVVFNAPVVDISGEKHDQQVTRIGPFNAILNGDNTAYLKYESGHLTALKTQPSGSHVRSIENFDAQNFETSQAISIDPTRGQLLNAFSQQPDLIERFHQGGIVGYVIALLGLIALTLSVYRVAIMRRTQQLFKQQQQNIEKANDNNALGRVLHIAQQHPKTKLEDLELKLSEAIYKETPVFTQFHSILKIIAVIAPLMGLLGTVVGMIITFQAITLYGTGDPKLMASGISSALVTTVLGLLVAIPTLFSHNYLSEQAKHLTQVLEQQAIGQLALLQKS